MLTQPEPMDFYDVPEREETKRELKLGPPDQKSENTLQHLTKGWLPVNPSLLQVVKETIKVPTGIDKQSLVKTISKDPGLFLYTARSLKGTQEKPANNPLEALLSLEDERLREIFKVSESDISPHKIGDMSNVQAQRLQHTLLAAQAADTLASKSKISNTVAFSAASFRQIGLNLMAWNYPRIYAKYAGMSLKSADDLDRELQRALGISPLQVGIRLAAAWEIDPSIRAGLTTVLNNSEKVSEDPSLADILNLAELFAEIKDPKRYPAATTQWNREREKWSKTFPAGTFDEVEFNVKETLKIFGSVSKSIFSLPLHVKETAPVTKEATEESVISSNRYVKRCSPEVRRLFLATYARMDPGKTSTAALKFLVESVIVPLGFSRGCLFLQARDGRTMIPTLRVGECALSEYTGFLKTTDCGVQASPYNDGSFKGHGIGVTGKATDHISAGFSHGKALGILYLEVKEGGDQPDILLHFNAIRLTFLACLGSRGDSPHEGRIRPIL